MFAMEADPSRLAIMEETFQATSSLPSKICTLNAPNIAREGADTGQGVPPIHKINLVLSGPSTANQQQSLAPRFNRVKQRKQNMNLFFICLFSYLI